MPKLDDICGMPRKEKLLLFIIDASGHMEGKRIWSIKRSLYSMFEHLSELQKSNEDYLFKVQIMFFGSSVEWIPKEKPSTIDDFPLTMLDSVENGGLCDVGNALIELNKRLNRHDLISMGLPKLLPSIIFLGAGYSTDNYVAPLEVLKQNRWYASASKLCFSLGEDADCLMIKALGGDLIEIDDFDSLETKLLEFLFKSQSFFTGEPILGDILAGDEDFDFNDPRVSESDTVKAEIGTNIILPEYEQKKESVFQLSIAGVDVPLLEGENVIYRCQVLRCSPERAMDPLLVFSVDSNQEYVVLSKCFVDAFLYYPLNERSLIVPTSIIFGTNGKATLKKTENGLDVFGKKDSNTEMIVLQSIWDEDYRLWSSDYIKVGEDETIITVKRNECLGLDDFSWDDEEW